MSERVSVASEEKPGKLVVESVTLMIVAAVGDRALAVSGVWRPSAVRKSNFLLERVDGKAAAIRTTGGQTSRVDLVLRPTMRWMRFVLFALATPALAFQLGAAPTTLAARRCASPAAQFELPDFSKMASDLSKMASPPESANEPSEDGEPKKGGISMDGLFQLMTMGAGAPSLGELKENNLFKSPEERKDANGNVKSDLTFELEANNFFDKSGNIQKGSYMEDGWVDESAGPEGPGFFENLFGKK